MRFLGLATLLAVSFIIPSSAVMAGQQSTASQTCTSPNPVRDAQGLTLLQQSINAFGGASAVTVVKSTTTHATVTSLGSDASSGNVTWEDDFSGSSYEFRTTFQTDSWTRVFLSGHGSPGQIKNDGSVQRLQSHVAYADLPYYLPSVVLARDLADSSRNIKLIGATTISGKAAIHVRITLDCGPMQKLLSAQDWYLDPLTALPLRVEYLVPNTTDITDVYVSSVDYSDFRPINGTLVPFADVVSEGGKPTCSIQITAVEINPIVSPNDFDLPQVAAQPGGVQ